jgi:hypothetical protein
MLIFSWCNGPYFVFEKSSCAKICSVFVKTPRRYFLTAVKANYTLLYNRLNYVIKVNYFLRLFNYFLTAVSANYVFIQPAPAMSKVRKE